MQLTEWEQKALDIVTGAQRNLGKTSVMAHYVAKHMNDAYSLQRWGGVLDSLVEKGLLVTVDTGFASQKFYALKED